MSPVVSPYDPLPTINSALLRNPPDAVPPTDELESLHAELKLLKERTLERAKKAGEDLKIIEESMRRMKEKEKGKAKALEKVKKERGCTCHYSYSPCYTLTIAFILVLMNALLSPLTRLAVSSLHVSYWLWTPFDRPPPVNMVFHLRRRHSLARYLLCSRDFADYDARVCAMSASLLIYPPCTLTAGVILSE